MAEVQTWFTKFHDAIKLGRFAEEADLREKRDVIVKKLRERLPDVFEGQDRSTPSFAEFDQGSYAMGTGVKPLEGDYDIDEGIAFDIRMQDYPDPVEVKQWVRDALEGHTDHPVEIRKSCVRVTYQLKGEPVYHVDLPIYAHDGLNKSNLYLARGLTYSASDKRVWERSDPKGFCDLVDTRFSGEEAEQFRRCVRYLKRWRDVKFDHNGNAAPVGIGVTLAAYSWFLPVFVLIDITANRRHPNDLAALRQLVERMLNQFMLLYHDGEWAERLSVTMPVAPNDDPFQRMTNTQMTNFKAKLERLHDALRYAEDPDVEPQDACEELQKVFGDDFPTPPKDDTGKRKAPAILTSSASA